MGVVTAEYMDVFCNPGLFNAARNSRITLRFIQATECEARAPHFLGYVFCADKNKFIWNEFVLRMQTRRANHTDVICNVTRSSRSETNAQSHAITKL